MQLTIYHHPVYVIVTLYILQCFIIGNSSVSKLLLRTTIFITSVIISICDPNTHKHLNIIEMFIARVVTELNFEFKTKN